ncbi:hypothetical protein XENOCAPTIV_030490 [Xenoophorus captivus]|uniref:Uncharacterized protein n=1 Tax=Xenoophorus captivus TaxID=1517983 RepID=A0ABV0QFE5_9TELE
MHPPAGHLTHQWMVAVNKPPSSDSQLFIFYRFFHSGSRGSWCLSPAVYGDTLPLHCRATQTHTGQTALHTLTHKDNLEKPINLTVMFLDCGRKPEYLERTRRLKNSS